MRIDKQVIDMLTARPAIWVDAVRGISVADIPPGFEDWFRQVINNAVDDPMVDMIAAERGLTANDIMRFLSVVGLYDPAPRSPEEEWEIRTASYFRDVMEMHIVIPRSIFDLRDAADVANAFFHELSHAADAAANLPRKMKPPGWLGPGSRFLETILLPREQRAIKTQILELLLLDYTDDQIVTQIIDSMTPEYAGEAYQRVGPAVEHQIHTWIEQVRRDNQDIL
jgi:hypothetical protein